MKNCIYKKGEDKCVSPVVPNCLFYCKGECSYDETEDAIRSYRLMANKIRSERRMEDYK